MAKLYNLTRALGVVLVPDGTRLYNNQPVIGIRDVGTATRFANNRRVFQADVQPNGAKLYNDQQVVGAVLITDGRVLYNNQLVIPAKVQATVTAGYLTGTPMATLPLMVTAGTYPFTPTSYSRQIQASDNGVTGWANVGAAFGGATFVAGTDLIAKYLRLVETASDGSHSVTTITPALGPVVAFIALAALPLASGAKVSAIGDSQIGYNSYYGTAAAGTGQQVGTKAAVNTGYGFIAHAKMIDPRFRFDSWYDISDPTGRNLAGANQGVFGDHLDWTGGILSRLPAVLARRPDILVVEGGINTVSSGDFGDGVSASPAYVIQKLDRCLTLARQAGTLVILMTLYPRGDWATDDPKQATVSAVNAWIRAQAGRSGVVAVLDTDAALAPSGVFDTSMYRADKIHLSAKGALVVGRDCLLPILQANVSAGSYFDQDPAVGNLLPATLANLEGTTGAKTGTPNTGTVPTGITVARGRNCAIENSVDQYASGKNRLNMAITPGGTDSNEYYEITVSGFTTATFATEATKWYQAFVYVECDSDTSLAFIEVIASLRLNTTSQVISYGGSREASGDFIKPMPANRGWWVQSEKFTNVDAAAIDRANMLVRITGPKTGAPLNVKISRPIIREVSDPRPIFAAGAKVAALGHSFIGLGALQAYGASQAATNGHQGFYQQGRAAISWVANLDGRFNIDMFSDLANPFFAPNSFAAFTGAMQGKSGDGLGPDPANVVSFPGTLARTDYVIARGPAIVYLDIGYNDIAKALKPIAGIIADYDTQIKRLTSAGITVIPQTLSAVMPNIIPAGDIRLSYIDQLNAFIVAQDGKPGVKVCNTLAIDGPQSGIDASMFVDGLHPAPKLMRLRANVLLGVLQSLVAPGETRSLDPLASYNIFPAKGTPGNTGTKTNVTGEVATGMRGVRATGTSTYVASKEVVSSGNEKQVFTVTPVDDGTVMHSLNYGTTSAMSLSSLGLAAGDWVEIEIPVELDDWAGWDYQDTSIRGPILIDNNLTVSSGGWKAGNSAIGRNFKGVSTSKLWIPPGLTITNIRTDNLVVIRHLSNVGGTGVVKIGAPIFRKIADPRAAWNL